MFRRKIIDEVGSYQLEVKEYGEFISGELQKQNDKLW